MCHEESHRLSSREEQVHVYPCYEKVDLYQVVCFEPVSQRLMFVSLDMGVAVVRVIG